jgi:hypothetical protein
MKLLSGVGCIRKFGGGIVRYLPFWFGATIALSQSGALIAAGSPPVIDAGPAKQIAFPARDLTLFGHATDPDRDELTYSWAQLNGPAPAVFSAAWGLATTVTFSQPGNYVFRLSVSDGTSVVTSDAPVTVFPESSQTSFYVDPTYSGSSSDGSASRPWKSLSRTASSAEWSAINAALANDNVIVYFSARMASVDIAEIEQHSIDIWRTDRTAHILTLDGVSKYNTNDATPSWTSNSSGTRFRIAIANGSLSIGVQSSNTAYPMNYTTIRGFDLSGASGRALIAGNNTVFEYNYVHDVTTVGATVQFQAAVRDYPNCTPLFGNLKDITFRSNTVARGEGESFYIAGTYTRTGDGGCLTWGNTHSDILIENNTVGEAGVNGGEHDGFDLKAGLTNVTLRGNRVSDRPAGTRGISALGVFYAEGTCCVGNYVIENNFFTTGKSAAILLQKQNGAVVRNNVSVGGGWIGTSGDLNNGYWTSQNVAFFNNSLYGNQAGIVASYVNKVVIQNNLLFQNGSGAAIQGNSTATNALEDYNVYDTDSAQVAGGGHSLRISSTSGLVVDAPAGNLRLRVGSPAIDRGVDLSSTGFASDISGAQRKLGGSWDIGAYAYSTSTVRPSAPSHVRIIVP